MSLRNLTKSLRSYLKSRLVLDPEWSENEAAKAKSGRRDWIRRQIALIRPLKR